MASRIEDYGLIGNLRTSALVSDTGSIDWLCAPRFDSDAMFSSLIGYDEHGQWALRPSTRVKEFKQRYRGDTLILETDIVCETGIVRRTEFMPITEDGSEVIRILEGIEGEVPMEMLLNVKFGYGAYPPLIDGAEKEFILIAGPDAVVLRSNVEMKRNDKGVNAYFNVKKGDRIEFQMGWYMSNLQPPKQLDVAKEFRATENFWIDWASRCTYQGKYRDAVMRSLITLKALIYAPTGGIVAAPTTSLPEELGGVRNWDYRFCWIRDSSLTLQALMLCGYADEATAFRDWLIRAVAGDPEQIQIMYNIDGGRRLTEFELDFLPGYENSKPVHIGNAASGQFQLDIFGEVLNALYLASKMGMPRKEEATRTLRRIVNHLTTIWQYPDDGIWEVRGGRRHFTHSKVMAWVAVDRVVRYIDENPDIEFDPSLLSHLRTLRERIHEEVSQRGFHKGVNAFTQSYGAEVLDASVLLIPHYGFLPAHDPKVKGTVEAVENTLLRDGFVLRYENQKAGDGLPGSEGAFLACSFWLVDNYYMVGRKEEAEALFDKLLSLRNHLGLLAEEFEPSVKRQIGNFPQAFSHLALIATAHLLTNGVHDGNIIGVSAMPIIKEEEVVK